MLSLKDRKVAIGDCGLLKDDGPRAVRATIESGIRAGLSKPRDVPKPDRERRTKRRPSPQCDRALSAAPRCEAKKPAQRPLQLEEKKHE